MRNAIARGVPIEASPQAAAFAMSPSFVSIATLEIGRRPLSRDRDCTLRCVALAEALIATQEDLDLFRVPIGVPNVREEARSQPRGRLAAIVSLDDEACRARIGCTLIERLNDRFEHARVRERERHQRRRIPQLACKPPGAQGVVLHCELSSLVAHACTCVVCASRQEL